MSTRATYRFIDKRIFKIQTVIYIHHDGYPEGAAGYLYTALINPSQGNFATQFIRANEGAELTSSHDDHGDTEFCYDVEGHGLEAGINAYKIKEDRQSVCFFTGKLHEFITKYYKREFKVVKFAYSSTLVDETMASQLLERPVSHLERWRGKFEDSANWNSCVAEIKSITDVFPDLLTDKIKSLIERE